MYFQVNEQISVNNIWLDIQLDFLVLTMRHIRNYSCLENQLDFRNTIDVAFLFCQLKLTFRLIRH